MHRTDRYLEKVFFGFDSTRFYLRLDLPPGLDEKLPEGASFQLQFMAPREYLLSLERNEYKKWQCQTLESPTADLVPEFAGAKIFELGIPLKLLGIEKPDEVRFSISIHDQGRELERFPSNGFLTVSVDPWGLDHQQWIV